LQFMPMQRTPSIFTVDSGTDSIINNYSAVGRKRYALLGLRSDHDGFDNRRIIIIHNISFYYQ